MRKLSLVLVAALAIFFAGCNKNNNDNPSIADTSAKQTQPTDEQSASAEDITDQSSASNVDQAQGVEQDQTAQAQDQINPDQSITANAPLENAAGLDQSAAADAAMPNNSTAQLDESQTSQAQIPGLPDANNPAAPTAADNNSAANPQS